MTFASRLLSGDPVAARLLPTGWRTVEGRRAAVERARPASAAVVEALARQGRALAGEGGERAARRLGEPGAVAVVAGQQVGLLLGPLYTLHKAAGVVAAARALEAETGRPCVPVFWLQTEDHDLDEIRSVGAVGPGGLLTLEVPDDGRGRVSVWHRTLPPEVDEVVAEARGLVSGAAPHREADAWLGAWRAGRRWHEAFAEALGALLAPHGLALVDPRDPALATLGATVLARALEEAAPIAAALHGRADALRAAGFEPQVHVREDAPLPFFHPEGPEGERFRLELALGAWRLVGDGRTVSRAAVRDALEADPRVASTSALLRPILQDTLLPTAVVMGGPGELAYFAQLAPLYRHYGLPEPLFAPRASFRLMDARSRSLLEALGLTPDQLGEPREALLAHLAAQSGLPAADAAEALHAEVAAALDRLEGAARPLGAALDRPLSKTRASVTHSVGRLAEAWRRALAAHADTEAGRLDRLLARLQPGGAPQERALGVIPWIGAGPAALAARLVEAARPFDAGMVDVVI